MDGLVSSSEPTRALPFSTWGWGVGGAGLEEMEEMSHL